MPSRRAVEIWFFAGSIERGRNYAWCDGYSRLTRHGGEQPWLTKREAQSAAKRNGATAVFYKNQAAAEAARDALA